MKLSLIAAVSTVLLTSTLGLAQNVGTGPTAPPGDSAVSPAAGGPSNAASNVSRPALGAGINSGAMNNGTTGDTIGTGHGTSSAPGAAPGGEVTATPNAGGRKP